MNNDEIFCSKCGAKLIIKELEHEGDIPYCPNCNTFHFPPFSTAVSMIVICEGKTLLIKQYGKDRYILVAGYISKGESAEDACKRELKEEVNLEAKNIKILKTSYFSKTNVLMINCLVEVYSQNVLKNYEVDSFEWFTYDDAKDKIASGSLAEQFYLNFYNNYR